jgi:hypothetical protein
MVIKLKDKNNKDKFIFRINYVGNYFNGWSILKIINEYFLIMNDKGKDYFFKPDSKQDLYKS